MGNRIFWTIAAMGILSSFLLVSPTAFAKGKPDGTPSGFEKGEKKGWGESQVPPGWGKGEKKGWKGQSTPPGLPEPEEEE